MARVLLAEGPRSRRVGDVAVAVLEVGAVAREEMELVTEDGATEGCGGGQDPVVILHRLKELRYVGVGHRALPEAAVGAVEGAARVLQAQAAVVLVAAAA